MGKLLEKDWRFPNEDSLDRITDALLWELSRTVYNESSEFRESVDGKAWPMFVKQWPNESYYTRKRKLAEFSYSMFSEPVNLWTIRKPDVLARLISNLRAKPPLNEDKTIVGVVGESPSLAMSESLGYGAIKMYVDLRSPTPELIKDFDKMVKKERLKHMPDICDRFGNLKKGKGLVKSPDGVAELVKSASVLLNSLGLYRIYKKSQESVARTLDFMSENNLKLVDEKTIRDKIHTVKVSLNSISAAYTSSGG
jgi:hypothetical protein